MAIATATFNTKQAKTLLDKYQTLRMKTLSNRVMTELYYWISQEIQATLEYAVLHQPLGDFEVWEETIGNKGLQVRSREERIVLDALMKEVVGLYQQKQESVSTDTYDMLIAQYEQTLERFMHSPDFKETLVRHLCRNSERMYPKGHYLPVELFPNGLWESPAQEGWSSKGSAHHRNKTCIVLLAQIEEHSRKMKKIGETRSFQSILSAHYDEARNVATQLYEQQREYLWKQTLHDLASMKERRRLD